MREERFFFKYNLNFDVFIANEMNLKFLEYHQMNVKAFVLNTYIADFIRPYVVNSKLRMTIIKK